MYRNNCWSEISVLMSTFYLSFLWQGVKLVIWIRAFEEETASLAQVQVQMRIERGGEAKLERERERGRSERKKNGWSFWEKFPLFRRKSDSFPASVSSLLLCHWSKEDLLIFTLLFLHPFRTHHCHLTFLDILFLNLSLHLSPNKWRGWLRQSRS